MGFSASAQLLVDGTQTPERLVHNTLLGKLNSLRVFNIIYEGQTRALGRYKTIASHINLDDGLILSTGDIRGAIGPNSQGNAGEFFHRPGDSDLNKVANNYTHDAAVLQFDFVADYDALRFHFVFASEEYPEFVGKGVNDVFAFWLTDLETGKKTNLAVIPGTDLPVTVDNINAKKNSHLFIANAHWNPNNVMQWENDRKRGEYAYILQYDGLTHWLLATALVRPGQKYRLRMAIADAGDGLFDSAVLLRAGSFVSAPATDTIKPVSVLLTTFRGMRCDMRGDTFRLTARLHFEHDAADTYHVEDSTLLHRIAGLLKNNPALSLRISGHTDNAGTPSYNERLARSRAQLVYRRLVLEGVSQSRIQFRGFGARRPLSDNESEEGKALNRRVEFDFFGW